MKILTRDKNEGSNKENNSSVQRITKDEKK